MRIRARWVLFVFGLLLVFVSLAALAYAFQPVQVLHAGGTLAPTLFTLTPGGIP